MIYWLTETGERIILVGILLIIVIQGIQLAILQEKIVGLKPQPPDPMVDNYVNGMLRKDAGLYIPNCGFFVDTRGKTYEDVKDVGDHEYCHTYIYQNNYTHFCGD